ncbi:MAG: class I SAM-dependent methyltransferase [Spirochaetes bacterium]|nr:class I SAM-dependent methyltransferase [Spirochaetota bacterium]
MDNRDKFTDKAILYAKYRPSYPQEFIDYLYDKTGMNKDSIVADIGAGTGILTKLLSGKVKKIYAVEPNQDMLMECKKYLKGTKNISCIDASAENTTLPDSLVDFVTVAQAFHWFDKEKAKSEFRRILKTGGKAIIIWNNKPIENDFLKENSVILKKYCTEFKGFTGGVDTKQSLLSDFFKNSFYDYKIFENNKKLNLEEFIGGILSASYSLSEGNLNYDLYISELTGVFNKYSINGILKMKLKTHCYIGEL